MDNHSIRMDMKNKRKSLSTFVYQRLCFLIRQSILHSSEYSNAKMIGIYVSANQEVDTHILIKQALKDKKRICVPKIIDNTMAFYEIESMEDLSAGVFGILEPKTSKIVKKASIDVVYVPLLAYNDLGYRIGYGKGYYDYYLADYTNRKIGLAFSFQNTNQLDIFVHDVKLDKIYTDIGRIDYT